MPDEYYRNEFVAARYDEQHRNNAVTIEDIPFYVDLASRAAAAGQAVLELGCGTGRVSLPVAAAGAAVVGLDSAPEMLDVARGKAPDATNPVWVEGDMAGFDLGRQFGLVIIPFRSFLLLLSPEDQASCLRCAYEHLLPGGRLALNVFNPDLRLIEAWQRAKAGSWQIEGGTNDEDILTTRNYSTEAQTLNGTDRFVSKQATGRVIVRMERNLRLRYVFPDEMRGLLTSAGFEVEAAYGWFDGRPLDDGSSEMVWLARKPDVRS